MKNHATVALCGIMALAMSGVLGLGSLRAQDAPSKRRDRLVPTRPAPIAAPAPPGDPWAPMASKVMLMGRPDGMHEIRSAAEQLSEAEDDDSKAEAEEKLSELLDDYFEEDMKRREQELADVEARVKKLRELMERRRAKKDDIIELQKEVLVNEAEGLGFFNGGVPGGPQLPMGHPIIPGGTVGGGGEFRFAVPPPPGAAAGEYRAIYKEGKRRPAETEKKPPNDDRPR